MKSFVHWLYCAFCGCSVESNGFSIIKRFKQNPFCIIHLIIWFSLSIIWKRFYKFSFGYLIGMTVLLFLNFCFCDCMVVKKTDNTHVWVNWHFLLPSGHVWITWYSRQFILLVRFDFWFVKKSGNNYNF